MVQRQIYNLVPGAYWYISKIRYKYNIQYLENIQFDGCYKNHYKSEIK